MTKASDFDPTFEPLVIVVTGDQVLRERLRVTLRAARIEILALESTAALLSTALPDRPGCLVVDVLAPRPGALELRAKNVAIGGERPIILVTAPGELPISENALNASAFDTITRPIRDRETIGTIKKAIVQDAERRRELNENRLLASMLSPLEIAVMAEMVKGLLNKQIAQNLGISETTVKVHRGNVMRRMKASSIADLVRKLGLANTER